VLLVGGGYLIRRASGLSESARKITRLRRFLLALGWAAIVSIGSIWLADRRGALGPESSLALLWIAGFAVAAWALAYLALWGREMLMSRDEHGSAAEARQSGGRGSQPQRHWKGLGTAFAVAGLYGAAAIPAGVAVGIFAEPDAAKVCVAEGAFVGRFIGETPDRVYIGEVFVPPRAAAPLVARELIDRDIVRVLSIPNPEVQRLFTGQSPDLVALANCAAAVRP
jgi:hypothetical protein